MIPISKPLISENEINSVSNVLSSGDLTQGRKVQEFEDCFAQYLDVKHAVAVNSGTAALHLSLVALGLKKGDEVITTPFTFAATANSILYCGAKPVFVDINPQTFNIDVDRIEEKITNNTKGILPVHLYGQPCDLGRLLEISRANNIFMLEDCCQAHGAEYDGKKVGSFATGAFSFYPTKNMTTGEGGIISTNDVSFADKLRVLRNHGQSKYGYCTELGYNYRMTDFSAAMGVEQLKKLDTFNKLRFKNAAFLTKKLKSIEGLVTPAIEPNTKHVFHQYTLRILNGRRDQLLHHLRENEIDARVYYPLPLHMQPLYKYLEYGLSLSEAEKASSEVLSLPIYPALTKDELITIVTSISDFFA
ncbi:MAG: DegT/DnrJ/EryC1/StrS family aminotransferase [Candidatus Aenigmarchaeota archaeon]|nr:DegT/DnrJ/EryC1/StrS family aminotransferase [Candidatus Aenigmarchaeota archaeon]